MMFIGIFFVLIACFIWGLIFVIPQLMPGFSPLEVALGRYFVFGLISLFVLPLKGIKRWAAIPFSIWKKGLLYALNVTFIYYFFLVLGIQYSNASLIALLVGISPITLAFLGNCQEKVFDFEQLIFPSLCIASGLILVNTAAFQLDLLHVSLAKYLFGLFSGCLALAAWNWYVIANAKFLKAHPQLPASDWATIIGVCTLFWVLIIGGMLFWLAEPQALQKYWPLTEESKAFWLGSLALGSLCSWFGAYLWNRASHYLPVSLAGQLTIFETIFGLIFAYGVESRLPNTTEISGVLLILGGIAYSMWSFNVRKRQLLTPSPE